MNIFKTPGLVSPLTTNGDLWMYANGDTRIPIGTANQVLSVNSGGNALQYQNVASINNFNVATLTGATTLTTSNDFILASGTTFAITMFSPTGNSGKVIRVLKTDDIATTISFTGVGVPGITLSTINEEISILCDGSTFWSFNHKTNTALESYGASPRAFGTVTGVSFGFTRTGDRLNVFGMFTAGTVGGSLATINLPPGLSIDTTKMAIGNTTGGPGQKVGTAINNTGTGSDFFMLTAVLTSVTLIYFSNPYAQTSLLTPQNGSVLNSNALHYIEFSVPIAGWGP